MLVPEIKAGNIERKGDREKKKGSEKDDVMKMVDGEVIKVKAAGMGEEEKEVRYMTGRGENRGSQKKREGNNNERN